MKYNEILSLSNVLNEGFFAARVVRILKERKNMSLSVESLFTEILDLINKARKGETQVASGKLESNALDSIGAYHRARSIITLQSIAEGSEKIDKKGFDNILQKIESEVQGSISQKTIDPNDLKQTLTFFEFIKNQTSSEASKYYSKNVEVVQWQTFLC